MHNEHVNDNIVDDSHISHGISASWRRVAGNVWVELPRLPRLLLLLLLAPRLSLCHEAAIKSVYIMVMGHGNGN